MPPRVNRQDDDVLGVADISDETSVKAFGNNQQTKLALPLRVPVAKSMNMVINRPAEELALGMQSGYASDSVVGQTKRLYFVVPWKGVSMVGTTHSTQGVHPESLRYDEDEINWFVDDVNTIFPHLSLQLQDVLYCYQGLSPLTESTDNDAAVLHHSLVVDHASTGGADNLISVVSVKWTTARSVAQKAVDIVAKKLGSSEHSATLKTPVARQADIPVSLWQCNDKELVQFCQRHMDRTMTLMLADMLLRRTDDFVLGRLSHHQIALVAKTMADHLGWDSQRCAEQHDRLLDCALPEWRRLDLATLRWWENVQ